MQWLCDAVRTNLDIYNIEFYIGLFILLFCFGCWNVEKYTMKLPSNGIHSMSRRKATHQYREIRCFNERYLNTLVHKSYVYTHMHAFIRAHFRTYRMFRVDNKVQQLSYICKIRFFNRLKCVLLPRYIFGSPTAFTIPKLEKHSKIARWWTRHQNHTIDIN